MDIEEDQLSIFDSEKELDYHLENFIFLDESYQKKFLTLIQNCSDNIYNLLDLKSRYFVFTLILKFNYLLDYQFLFKSLTGLCNQMFVDRYTKQLTVAQIDNLKNIFERSFFKNLLITNNTIDFFAFIRLSSLTSITTIILEDTMIQYYHEDYNFSQFFSRQAVSQLFLYLAQQNQFVNKKKIFTHLLKIHREFALNNFAPAFKNELGIYICLA